MDRAVVIMLFFVVRVFLVVGILFALPRIARKGLLFGVYVGEAFAGSDEALAVRRSWDRGCVAVMVIAFAVGFTIAAFGWPVTGNLTGTGVLLVAGLVLYVRTYTRVRALAPPDAARHAARVTAFIQRERSRAETHAKLVLILCLLASLGTIIYALISYRAMPDRIPVPSNVVGRVQGVAEKSLLAVLYTPVLDLVLGPLYAGLAWMVARAKRSLREGADEGAAAVQDGFRALVSNVLSGTALFLCAVLTLYSVQRVRIGLSQTTSVGAGIWWLSGGFLLFAVVSLIGMMGRYGQGGALLERRQPQGELTGGLADNAHWVLGMFYVDRDDPSLMVEERFGIGYTMNWGNPRAVLIAVGITSSIVALISLAFFL